jgi:hypothetical protein
MANVQIRVDGTFTIDTDQWQGTIPNAQAFEDFLNCFFGSSETFVQLNIVHEVLPEEQVAEMGDVEKPSSDGAAHDFALQAEFDRDENGVATYPAECCGAILREEFREANNVRCPNCGASQE